MARLLVIGRNGQVATTLSKAASADPSIQLTHVGRPDLDLGDTAGLADQIAQEQPDIVINPAAYTAVDRAESEPQIAHAINAIAAGEIARGAAFVNAPIIHLSTDYVFDGYLDRPYREEDAPAPLSVYGQTKLEGEQRVCAANSDHLIVRTSWIYSPHGSNFLTTMLRLGAERGALSIVDDQIGCPTSADDLAQALLQIAKRKLDRTAEQHRGIMHLAGSGHTSWFGFAQQMFKAASGAGHATPTLSPVSSSQFPTKALRPANSRLDCKRAQDVLGIRLADWQSSVERVTLELVHTRG